ncbi:unnamed protein product [Prunus armeniaca]
MSPIIVLNETPLHDKSTSDLPLDYPMNQDSPIQREPRPIERKAAKTKRISTSTSDCAKILEQIAINNTLRIERDMKRDAADKGKRKGVHTQTRHEQEGSGNHGHGYKPYVP